MTVNEGAPTWMPWIQQILKFPGSNPIVREANPDYASIPEKISDRMILDFLNMIRLAMTYSEKTIRQMFPVDVKDPLDRKGYQIINEKYDMVVEYMKTTYNIDITKYAAILDGN